MEEETVRLAGRTAIHPYEMTAFTSAPLWENSFVKAYECFENNGVYRKLTSELVIMLRQISKLILL